MSRNWPVMRGTTGCHVVTVLGLRHLHLRCEHLRWVLNRPFLLLPMWEVSLKTAYTPHMVRNALLAFGQLPHSLSSGSLSSKGREFQRKGNS